MKKQPLSLPDLTRKFHISIPFTIYFNLIFKIKNVIRGQGLGKLERLFIPNYLKFTLLDEKDRKNMFKYLNVVNNSKPKHQERWMRVLNQNEDYMWKNQYPIVFNITKDKNFNGYNFEYSIEF